MSARHPTPDENLERAAVLDELLRLDGRTDPTHPYRDCHSGLGRPFTRIMQLEGSLAHLEALIHTVARLEARVQALEAAAADLHPPSSAQHD